MKELSMAFSVAVVAAVGVLGVVNLVLSFGVIRRLRDHTELLNQLAGRRDEEETVMMRPGETVGAFAGTTVDGEAVSLGDLVGTTLVGFFSPRCTPCVERLPMFVEHARQHQGAGQQVIAVVVGDDDDDNAGPLVATLAGVARVVRDVDSGPMSTAFGVQGFPAFALVESDGVVRASGHELSALLDLAPA
jgi:hypothetical protein